MINGTEYRDRCVLYNGPSEPRSDEYVFKRLMCRIVSKLPKSDMEYLLEIETSLSQEYLANTLINMIEQTNYKQWEGSFSFVKHKPFWNSDEVVYNVGLKVKRKQKAPVNYD